LKTAIMVRLICGRVEKILGRPIARRAPGRKPTSEDHNQLRLL